MSKELREAAEEALTVLSGQPVSKLALNAAMKLKAALEAEPVEQEPVAYMYPQSHMLMTAAQRINLGSAASLTLIPLYTHPKPFERLSDDEVEWLMFNKVPYGLGKKGSYTAFANAIQDAIAEKNK